MGCHVVWAFALTIFFGRVITHTTVSILVSNRTPRFRTSRNINARSKKILRFCDLGHMRGKWMELSYRDRIGESLASVYGATFKEGSWWYENPDEDKFFAALFQRASGGKPLSQVDVARVFLKGDKRQINIHEPALRKVGLSKDALRDLFCVTKAAGGEGVVEIPQPEGNSVPFGEVPAVEEDDDDGDTVRADGAMEEDQDLSNFGSCESGGMDDTVSHVPGGDAIWGEGKLGFGNDVVSLSQPLEDFAIEKFDDIFPQNCCVDDVDAKDPNAQLYPLQTWLQQAEMLTDGISGQLRGSPMEKSLIPHVEKINEHFSAMSAKVRDQVEANAWLSLNL